MVYWNLSGPPGKNTTINWWFNWFNTNSIGNFVDGLLQIEPSPNHPQNRLYRDKPRYFRPASRVTRACNSSGLRYLPSCKRTGCLDQTWQFEITYEWRVFMGKSPINGKIIPSYTWFKYVPCLWMSFHGKIMAFIEDCNYCPLPSLIAIINIIIIRPLLLYIQYIYTHKDWFSPSLTAYPQLI